MSKTEFYRNDTGTFLALEPFTSSFYCIELLKKLLIEETLLPVKEKERERKKSITCSANFLLKLSTYLNIF